jgi:RND family efflux transporter MFP subunit
MKKRKFWGIAIVILAVVIGGGYYWWNKNKKGVTATSYVTVAAEKSSLLTSVSASGNVVVDDQETVSPTITGTVANLTVGVGDSVEKGQRLFTIINEQLGVDVTKAESAYLSAKNSLDSKELAVEDARASYEAAKKKDKKDGTTYTTEQLDVLDEKIDIAKGEIETAEKNLESAEASLNNVKEDAGKREVKAPIKGTINEINIKNGDDLSRNSSSDSAQSPIIIGDMTTLKVSVPINEVDISRLAIGQKATFTFDGIDSLTASGKVEKIDSLGTATQGVVSYNVLLGLDTLDFRIKPQMTVASTIVVSFIDNALVVPVAAIKTGNNGEFSVVVLENGAPKTKTVTVGETDGTNTEIKSGLVVGEAVITEVVNAETSNSTTSGSTSNQSRSGGGIFGGSGGVRLPHD